MPLIRRLQSLLDFQAEIGSAVHAILETEQLISHTRTAILNIIASFLDGEVIPVSEGHEFLNKIHVILDGAVPKLVGNTVHILDSFSLTSRQWH